MSKRKQTLQPYWRPNFRIPATLPDIKVIRTDFTVNFIAIMLVIIAGAYLVQREYRAHILGETIARMEDQVLRSEPDDKAYLQMNERFRSAAAHIVEAQKFYDSPIQVHELLANLTAVQPDDLIFSRITFAESIRRTGTHANMEYAINITGQVRDLRVLDGFKSALQQADFLRPTGFSNEVDEAVQAPDAQTRIFPYRLAITLSPKRAAPEGGQK